MELLINVLIMLAVGLLFIGISIAVSKRLQTADDYISGKGRLGIAFGTATLLAFWITGNTIMAAPEAAYVDGVSGALAYGFMGGIAVILFGPIAKRIHQIMPNAKTVGDFFKGRFGQKNYKVFFILLLIYMLGILATQGIGGGVLLEQLFGIPYILAVVLTFVVVIFYATIGGFASIAGLALIQVILMVAVVLIVPPLVFFTTGISPIYEGMQNLRPDALNALLPTGVLLAMAGSMMAIGQVFMDNTFWQRAHAIRRDKVGSIFVLAGIGWAFVPVAMSTLAFVAIGTGRTPAFVNQVAPYIAQIYGGQLATWLFLVCVWSALTSTIAAVLNAFVSLVLNDLYIPRNPGADKKQLISFGRKMTVVFGLIAMVLSMPRLLTMMEMMFFLGVINAAYIYPIALGIFWKKLNKSVVLFAVIAAVALGYTAAFTIGPLQGVVVSGWVSVLVCFAGSKIKPEQYNWNILEKIGT
jgi:Na+/proline symporter